MHNLPEIRVSIYQSIIGVSGGFIYDSCKTGKRQIYTLRKLRESRDGDRQAVYYRTGCGSHCVYDFCHAVRACFRSDEINRVVGSHTAVGDLAHAGLLCRGMDMRFCFAAERAVLRAGYRTFGLFRRVDHRHSHGRGHVQYSDRGQAGSFAAHRGLRRLAGFKQRKAGQKQKMSATNFSLKNM